MIFEKFGELEKLKDQDKVEFEELFNFHRDGVNVDQNGEGNLQKTNFYFDVSSYAGILDGGPGPD